MGHRRSAVDDRRSVGAFSRAAMQRTNRDGGVSCDAVSTVRQRDDQSGLHPTTRDHTDRKRLASVRHDLPTSRTTMTNARRSLTGKTHTQSHSKTWFLAPWPLPLCAAIENQVHERQTLASQSSQTSRFVQEQFKTHWQSSVLTRWWSDQNSERKPRNQGKIP